LTEKGLGCGMHLAGLHRLPAAFEHGGDRLLNPVVPAMPVADREPWSLEVAARRPAVVAMELVECFENVVQQGFQGSRGVEMLSG
jgi:hypothetical protein